MAQDLPDLFERSAVLEHPASQRGTSSPGSSVTTGGKSWSAMSACREAPGPRCAWDRVFFQERDGGRRSGRVRGGGHGADDPSGTLDGRSRGCGAADGDHAVGRGGVVAILTAPRRAAHSFFRASAAEPAPPGSPLNTRASVWAGVAPRLGTNRRHVNHVLRADAQWPGTSGCRGVAVMAGARHSFRIRMRSLVVLAGRGLAVAARFPHRTRKRT